MRASLRLLWGTVVVAFAVMVLVLVVGAPRLPFSPGTAAPAPPEVVETADAGDAGAAPATGPGETASFPVIPPRPADAPGPGGPPGEGQPTADQPPADQPPADQPPATGTTPGRDGGLLEALLPVRVPKPSVPPGPRRIGLQVGHWQTDQVPEELRRLEHATGTGWGGVKEWQVNLDVANRVAAVLRSRGYQVDILPTTVPDGYLADVFLAIHADGSTDLSSRGFKAAHGSRRGPFEGRLVTAVVEEYGRATRLPVDPVVTRNMRGYYAFSWSRFTSSVAPHTPAAILELGFLTNGDDRTVLLGQPDVVATGVVNGLQRFLDEVPAGAAFADDLLLPPSLSFRQTPPDTAPASPAAR